MAYEIILTLGQAFEVAYQLALQARKSGHGSSTLPESFDSKPSKPVPKPRVNIRKTVSSAGAQPLHSGGGWGVRDPISQHFVTTVWIKPKYWGKKKLVIETAKVGKTSGI